jgi:hypothetical protein
VNERVYFLKKRVMSICFWPSVSLLQGHASAEQQYVCSGPLHSYLFNVSKWSLHRIQSVTVSLYQLYLLGHDTSEKAECWIASRRSDNCDSTVHWSHMNAGDFLLYPAKNACSRPLHQCWCSPISSEATMYFTLHSAAVCPPGTTIARPLLPGGGAGGLRSWKSWRKVKLRWAKLRSNGKVGSGKLKTHEAWHCICVLND